MKQYESNLEPTPQEDAEAILFYEAGLVSMEDRFVAAGAGLNAAQYRALKTIFDSSISAALLTAFTAGWRAGKADEQNLFEQKKEVERKP